MEDTKPMIENACMPLPLATESFCQTMSTLAKTLAKEGVHQPDKKTIIIEKKNILKEQPPKLRRLKAFYFKK